MTFENVSIIIGATDEERSLQETVDVIMQTCDANDIARVIIVISASATEGCRSTIALLKEKYGDKIFSMVQKRPLVGGAVRDGFDAAESSHLMLLPADMAISLESIPEMIKRVKEKPDVISKTSRWMHSEGFIDYSPVRKVINKLSQLFLRVLFMSDITDFTNSVQTFPCELNKKAAWQEVGFAYLLEMVLLPLRLGYSIEEFPVKCYGRKQGKSKNSAVQTAMYLKTALRVRFTPKNKLLKEALE